MKNVFRPEDMVTVTLTLRFDPRAVDCAHCPLLETYARKQCRATGEYIYTDTSVGTYCPFLPLSEETLDKIGVVKK